MQNASRRIEGLLLFDLRQVVIIEPTSPSPGISALGPVADIAEAIGVGLLWRCQQTSARQSRAFRAHPSPRVVLVPDLLLTVRMVRRRSGCSTIKRLNTAWLGNTAAMMHYLRIINSRGSQYR